MSQRWVASRSGCIRRRMMEPEPREEAPPPGPLQQQLQAGEFGLLRRFLVFESDFVQVGRRGEVLDVHNRVRVVTMGVARTSPALPAPNVLLLARPRAPPPTAGVELTRLLPLRWVQVSVQDAPRERLRLRFASGRSFYLQLCPRPGAPSLFDRWARLVRVLRPPGEATPPVAEASPPAVALVGEALSGGPPPTGSADPEEAPAVSVEADGGSAGAPEAPSQPEDGSGGGPAPPNPLRSPPGPAEAPPPAPRVQSRPTAGKVCSRPREPQAAQRKQSQGRRASRIAALVKSLSGGRLGPGGGKR